MADEQKISKWWFWAFPALANAYVLLLTVLGLAGPSALPREVEVITVPMQLFIGKVAEPMLGKLVLGHDQIVLWLLSALGIWELAAVLLGLACYGAALLVHIIVPDDGQHQGSRPEG